MRRNRWSTRSAAPVISHATGLPRPRWRGLLHSWMFFVSLPAVVALIVLAERPSGRVGAAVFGASFLAVFGVSGAYHRLARSERAQRLMRRADHSMIFLLIAGTYTPVCLIALPPSWWIPLLSAVWSLTVVGIGLKLWGTAPVLRLSNSLYVIIGWIALVALPVFVRTVPASALALMLVGGVLYTVGAALFLLRRPDPNPIVFGYHEVWHTFTVVAAASHFGMVALVVT